MFARGKYNFDPQTLLMKGKRYSNGYVESRGKAGQSGIQRRIWPSQSDTVQ